MVHVPLDARSAVLQSFLHFIFQSIFQCDVCSLHVIFDSSSAVLVFAVSCCHPGRVVWDPAATLASSSPLCEELAYAWWSLARTLTCRMPLGAQSTCRLSPWGRLASSCRTGLQWPDATSSTLLSHRLWRLVGFCSLRWQGTRDIWIGWLWSVARHQWWWHRRSGGRFRDCLIKYIAPKCIHPSPVPKIVFEVLWLEIIAQPLFCCYL